MEEKKLKRDHRIVLVIGNGFDLDLGLKTSYLDFMRSSSFQDFLKKDDNGIDLNDNLFEYLHGKMKLKKWIDIEMELLSLATSKKTVRDENGKIKVEYNKATKGLEYTFSVLRNKLCDYLKTLNYGSVRKDSVALDVLRLVVQHVQSEIISYNYTNIRKLKEMVGGSINCPIEYVHGCLLDNSIILGFQDDVEIDKSFCFMIKSFSPYFKSHNVRNKLLNADEIIFFGHSLGSTDYHYFEDLFRFQSQADKARRNLILRIFTYNEEARRDILFQLREMNNRRTDMLYELCNFEIYRTADMDDNFKIRTYLNQLSKRIVKNRLRFD